MGDVAGFRDGSFRTISSPEIPGDGFFILML